MNGVPQPGFPNCLAVDCSRWRPANQCCSIPNCASQIWVPCTFNAGDVVTTAAGLHGCCYTVGSPCVLVSQLPANAVRPIVYLFGGPGGCENPGCCPHPTCNGCPDCRVQCGVGLGTIMSFTLTPDHVFPCVKSASITNQTVALHGCEMSGDQGQSPTYHAEVHCGFVLEQPPPNAASYWAFAQIAGCPSVGDCSAFFETGPLAPCACPQSSNFHYIDGLGTGVTGGTFSVQ